MAQDDFDLRELIGEDLADSASMPTIEDVPASQLPLTSVPKVESHCISPRVEHVPAPVPPENVKLSHPIPLVPMDVEYPMTPIGMAPKVVDQDLLPIDEKKHGSEERITESDDDLDAEYQATFTGTINEIKDLEPEALQTLRHRLARMIRRAKIQQRAIRVTEEGKLSLISEKRRATIKAKDTEFMSRRKAADSDAAPKTRKPSSPKADAGLSAAEKQVKQFVKLNMKEEVIRTTLAAVGTPIPENLTALIAKFSK